MKRLLRNVIHS